MDSSYLVTDDQLKENVSTVMQQQLQELAVRQGYSMRDADYVDYIETQTTVSYPITTWQQYRKGLRMRLPFLLLMSYLFKKSIASFLGSDLARKDYRIASAQHGFILDDFITDEISMVIPIEIARSMHLQQGTAKALLVTQANNASRDLQPGSLAIIDTCYKKPSLSGNYLLEKDNKPFFAAIIASAAEAGVKVQYGETIETIAATDINKLKILGRVVNTLG